MWRKTRYELERNNHGNNGLGSMVRHSGAIISFYRRIADLGLRRFDESEKGSGFTGFVREFIQAQFYGRDCVRHRPNGGWARLPRTGHAVYFGVIVTLDLSDALLFSILKFP